MYMLDTGDGLTVILVLAVMALTVGQFISMRQLRRAREELASLHARDSRQSGRVRKALQAVTASCRELTGKVTVLSQRQQELENRDSSQAVYSQAGRMIELGAASDDLVESCGLSEAEARLLAMMYQQGSEKRRSL
jgi:hypothetical protein